MNAEKWLWHIWGYKVFQSVPNGMKLELDLWWWLLDVYTMFQIDISKRIELRLENFEKSKRRKSNHHISECKNFATNENYVDTSTAIYLCTKFEGFISIYNNMIANKWLWLSFGCKVDQSDPIVMKLKHDLSCHLLNVYTKFQIDASKHVGKKSGKLEWINDLTDGRTDIATA